MAKQTVNIGTTANDGTGSTLRAAMDMINDNFNELYPRQGPVSGTLFDQVISAVKYIEVSRWYPGDIPCIDEIKAGTDDAGQYVYLVTLCTTKVLTEYPEVVAKYEATVGAAKTGTELIELSEYNDSGISGRMVINWSNLTLATHYQMPKWVDGSLYVLNVMPRKYDLKDSQIQVITTDEQTIDGSYDLYVIDNNVIENDMIVYLADVADVVGEINIMALPSLADHTYQIIGQSGKTLNGQAGKMAELSCLSEDNAMNIKVIPYDGNYLVIGNDAVLGNLPT